MNIKPMLGDYEIPGIQRIGSVERRNWVEVPVPGLKGSYHQDLGSAAICLRIEGSLAGDDARDGFLKAVREKFLAGDPMDFVADITTATEIDQVLIADMEAEEVAGSADTFRYTLTLAQYTEPPAPPAEDALDADLADEAAGLLDAMQLPDLLSAPNLSDPTPPLKDALDGVKSALGGLGGAADAIKNLFGGP